MNKTYLSVSLGAFAALLLASCATTPQRNEQLEQARAQVQSLEQDPYAQRAANEQLNEARKALQSADDAFNKHASVDDVNYYAYLAERHAETGKAQADEARAREQVASAGAERDRILLQAKTAQVTQAQAEAQNQAAQAAAARDALQREQQKEQQALANLNAHETQRGLELTLGSDVLFDTGSAMLKPGAGLQLDRLAGFMRQNPQTKIIIEGYTDSTGSAAFNESLSQRRAQAVQDALVAQSIDRDRIQAVGRGQDYPVASNATSAGRQQNRRVDIILSNMSGQFAERATQGPVLR
ncbi:MAG TPA: OmpA family protein [Steroidobacteraceae bacterium]|nr:OmpA family protein [Steroidobacteraceae bacterium]